MAFPPRQHGFTMIELVTVIILVGILAFVAVPRLSDTTFKERGFHDAVVAAISHARRVAVASRRYVCVSVNGGAGTLSLTRDTNQPESVVAVSCSSTLALPATSSGCAVNAVCAPTGITLNGGATTSLIFDPLGRSVTAPNVLATTISIATAQASISVYPETGYVQ